MKNLLLIGAGLMLSTLIACTAIKENVADGYDFGDLSVAYCSADNSKARAVVRATLAIAAAAKDVQIGVNYCDAIAPLQDGFSPDDVLTAWCSAPTPEARAQIRLLFDNRLQKVGLSMVPDNCEP